MSRHAPDGPNVGTIAQQHNEIICVADPVYGVLILVVASLVSGMKRDIKLSDH